jgi:hypothetical protein
MSETDINILLNATDEASGTIADASDQIDSSLNEVTDSTQQATEATDTLNEATQTAGDTFTQAASQADEINASYGNVATATDEASSSLKDNALAASQVAASGAALVMSISNIENAQVSVDRAHVLVEKDTNAVTSAQIAYNKACAEYGPNSEQAQLAASKLQAAQDALTVAQERAQEAQRNLSNDYMMAGVQVVPTVISAITALSTLTAAWPAVAGAASSATEALSGAMDFLAANPIILVIAGIAALILVLYEAYEHCGPFRDAVNEIAKVLGGALTDAFNAVKDALEWLWNNVLVPVGNFIEYLFVSQLNAAIYVINGFKTAVDDIYNALNWLWQNVLVPIGRFLEGTFLSAINMVMAPINALINGIRTIMNIGSSIGGAIGGALKAIGLAEGGIVTSPTYALVGEEGPEAVIPLSEPFGNALSDMGSAGGSSGGGGGTQNISMQISSQPTIQINGLSSNATLPEIIAALTDGVNRGQAQSLIVAVNRALQLQQARR